MATNDKILKLNRQLMPQGRAFKIPVDDPFDKLMQALAESETRAYDDAMSLLNSILPDNDEFTVDDAERWEERLGLISDSGVSLADRKLAIIRKMNHPGTIPARQSADYLEQQLQAAGFDVYVYYNNFNGVTNTPTDILGPLITGLWDFADDAEFGEVEFGNSETGSVFEDCVANYIDADLDAWFDVGDNLRNTFFIAGPYIDTFANVESVRENEFRQLILKLKPLQTVAFLFINYV